MSFYAGVDYSTRALDICLLDEDTALATHHRRTLVGPNALDRTRRIRDAMPARGLWHDDVIAVGIEQPFSRGAGGGYAMQLALGAILACIPADIHLTLIRADDWRKACDLPRRCDRNTHKAHAKRFARAHWADCPTVLDDNAADAYCIAYATRKRLNNLQERTTA